MRKNRGNTALRERVTITYKDKEYSGYYEATRGIVTVTYKDFGPERAHFRSHPELKAHHLLCELVRASLKSETT